MKWFVVCLIILSSACVIYTTNRTPAGIPVSAWSDYKYNATMIDDVYTKVVRQTVELYGGSEKTLMAARDNLCIKFVPFPFGVADIQNGQIVSMNGSQQGNLIKIAIRGVNQFKTSSLDSDFNIYNSSLDKIMGIVIHEITHYIAYQIDNEAQTLSVNHQYPFFGTEDGKDSVSVKVYKDIFGKKYNGKNQ